MQNQPEPPAVPGSISGPERNPAEADRSHTPAESQQERREAPNEVRRSVGKIVATHRQTPRGITRSLEVTKVRWELISSIVTVLGAIAAGIWAINEYLDKQTQARVQAALEYRKQYNAAPVGEARERISAVWLNAETEEESILQKGAQGEFADFVLRTIQAKKIAGDIGTVIEFYDVLAVCLRRNLCDDQTTLDLFGRDAEAYRNQHYSYLEAVRAQRMDTSFAEGLYYIASCEKQRRAAEHK
jgi:hypothetical protein